MKKTHVAIIGGGRGGTSLVEILRGDPLVKIVGLADTRPGAPAIRLAQSFKIPTMRDYRRLLKLRRVDILIDVTGNPEVDASLRKLKRTDIAVIGGKTAKFMWQLIEARIRSKDEIETHLREYKSLYELYMRETQHAISEERTRIALDIHDGLVQTLVGINFKLDLCGQVWKDDLERSRRVLVEARELLKVGIDEARQVVFNLKPLHFDKVDLVPAVRNFLKSYSKQYGIETSFKISGNERSIPPRVKIFLFRIIQEALSNVQKHAGATSVGVALSIGKVDLKATVKDDGKGFDLKEVSIHPDKWVSFGLKGIVERARLVGGAAEIDSKVGRGTKIVIRIPLLRKEEKIRAEN